MIFTFGRRLASIANSNWVPCDTAEVLQFGKTVAEDTDMLVYTMRPIKGDFCHRCGDFCISLCYMVITFYLASYEINFT